MTATDKTIWRACGAILFAAIIIQSPAMGGDDWPTFQGNPRRTGFTDKTLGPPYSVRWQAQPPGRISSFTQPIITGGRVFVATESGVVAALNARNGQVIWRFEAEGPFLHSVAVDGDRVFAACHDRRVYALNAADGKELWRFEAGAGFWASPCVADGKVMVGCRDTRFYALDAASGRQIWAYEAGEKIHQTAAYQNGLVSFGAEDGRVHMLDAATGRARWVSNQLPTISFRFTWPVFAGDTILYSSIALTNVLGGVHSGFDRDSRAIGWKSARPEDVSKLPPGATDPVVIRKYLDANPDRQCIFLLDVATGKLRSAAPGFLFMASPHPPPVVSPDGRIFFVHSGWYWGETSPAWLAEMLIGPTETNVKDLLKGGTGTGSREVFSFFPADIYAGLTGCGDIVFVASNSFGGFDYKANNAIRLTGVTNVSGSSGIVPADGCLYVISGGRLVCLQSQGANP